jgi:ABC-type antimicrobial peptide transport system ATPase subunit
MKKYMAKKRKRRKRVRIECAFVWESPQTCVVTAYSKAAAVRQLKQSILKSTENGKNNVPDRIKLKNVEFV